VSVNADNSHRNASVPLADCYLVSEEDASATLAVSKPVFRHWVAAGLISPVALPGGIRRKLYRRTDLEAFAASLAASR
jgi:hypothetical protein